MDTDRIDPDLTKALARGREPRKPPPTLLPSNGTVDHNCGSWWEIVFDAAVLLILAMLMMILLGMLAKC